MATKLEDIHTRFSNSASVVADEEARLLMKNLRVSQNSESAILDYMAALAHICSYKPHLFEELFAYPADAFVCMGVGNYADAQYWPIRRTSNTGHYQVKRMRGCERSGQLSGAPLMPCLDTS